MFKRLCAPLIAAMAILMTPGCLSMTSYVDPALGDVKPTERVQVSEKKPVQFIFSFQTNGNANTNATNQLMKKATDFVVASNMFSEVSTTPVTGGAILSITMNNVAEENAAGQGFVTGLTLGLAGSNVSDFYIATAKYSAGNGAPTTTVEKRHAIHTTVGAGSGPAGMTASKSIDEALTTVMRQLFEHSLNDVAKDPSFRSGQKVSQASPARVAG